MRSNVVPALCLAVGLVVCAAPVVAQNYDPDRVPSAVDAKEREACTPDVMRLCNDAIPDIPEIVACLKRQRLNLSPACAEVFGVTEAEQEPPPPESSPAANPKAEKKAAKTSAEKKKPTKIGPPLDLTSDAAKAK